VLRFCIGIGNPGELVSTNKVNDMGGVLSLSQGIVKGLPASIIPKPGLLKPNAAEVLMYVTAEKIINCFIAITDGRQASQEIRLHKMPKHTL
jgi:hypothetical protein